MLGSDSLQFLECGENFGVVGHLLIDGLKDAPGEIVFAGSIEGQAEDAPEWQIVGIPIDQDLESFGRLLPFAGIDVDLGGSEIESVSPAVQSVTPSARATISPETSKPKSSEAPLGAG